MYERKLCLWYLITCYLIIVIYSTKSKKYQIDPNGYVLFCPCMGRFGNQAEQFLGALAFTRILNRTLVLPHWIEYPQRAAGSFQVPFDRYFEVEPLESYLKVILMDDFMKYLANDVWPKGQRIVFCYTSRKNEDNQSEGCNAKEGNPFGPFWDKFSIDFDQDVFYHPLYFDISSAGDWNNRYPPSKYPVLAFTGPPGAFPAEQRHVHLAKYFIYSNYIKKKAENFLKKHAPKYNQTNLLAIHLRNGIDFKRACEYVIPKSNFFASAQCLGYSLEKGIVLSSEICYPSRNTIIKQVEHAVITHKPDYLFVAADEDHMIQQFQKTLEKKYNLKVLRYDGNENVNEAAHIDLYILGVVANHAIVNCPSTFSAFAKRMRDVNEKQTDFWGLDVNENDQKEKIENYENKIEL